MANNVLNGASVGFSSSKERVAGDTLIYEKIKLYEISLVTFPAYKSSEVNSRAKAKRPCHRRSSYVNFSMASKD